MKFKRIIASTFIILYFAAIFALSGCMLVPFGVHSCTWSTLDSLNTTTYYFIDELDEYSLCEFVDEELGIGFKIYEGDPIGSVYWGYVTVNGEKRTACFDMYGNGDARIYLSDVENCRVFNVQAAIVNLVFDDGEIICKSVEQNNYNINFSGLRLKRVSLDSSDFLPHENAFTTSISDKNQTLQVYRGSFGAYYIGKARTIENGEIKTYNIRLAFLEYEVFEIYDGVTGELLSAGTYDVIDYNNATLKFGQNDNLYAEKPFDSYPYLTISGIYYKGIF